MTREEEMWEAVEKEHGVLSRREAFVTLTAMEWADEHPNLSEEEQVGMEGLGMVWQKKHLINKAIDILIDMANDGCLIDIHNHEEFEKQFRKIIEE